LLGYFSAGLRLYTESQGGRGAPGPAKGQGLGIRHQVQAEDGAVALTEIGSALPINEQRPLQHPAFLPLSQFISNNFTWIRKLIQLKIIQNRLFFSQICSPIQRSLCIRASAVEAFDERKQEGEIRDMDELPLKNHTAWKLFCEETISPLKNLLLKVVCIGKKIN